MCDRPTADFGGESGERRGSKLTDAALAAAAVAAGHPLPQLLLPFYNFYRDVQRERFTSFMHQVALEGVASDLLERASREPRIADLFADAAQTAVATELERKRVALARILKSGMARDVDAAIDEEALLLRALSPLEAPHIVILDVMRTRHVLPDGREIALGTAMDAEILSILYPPGRPVLRILMSQLESWGLVIDDQPPATAQWTNARWAVTEFGARLCRFLQETPNPPG